MTSASVSLLVRILACNLGYLLRRRESVGGYAPAIPGALIGDESLERRSTARFLDLAASERPDVISLVEVDRGSVRTATDGQVDRLCEALSERGIEYEGAGYNKYGDDRLVGRLPIYRNLANGVLHREDCTVVPRYLSSGLKRLVLDVRVGASLRLFVVHLSLGSRCRANQLAELADLVESVDEPAIVAGDFNVFDGVSELSPLTDRAGLSLYAPGETVDERPLDDLVVSNRHLDLFCCSPELAVERCAVLDGGFSDHRPVVLDVEA
ncbi:endonuclease/exonuclease/phosphatase family protein [Halovivax gelatinilyticus]|uniref:endonuclease/exonuclease/phosphatase family protein n=1 Tax=Halovivax gelatinilyticus TaxID=2961597 RepID=UPI0020CA3090|nr:endonuclease/exonuclease/phosphatase family protein [Halovivax gelatinilyticus]